ncbi:MULTISPECIES: hypothetical protein [Aquimarina]|uniref:Bacteriocin n=1 Tax=Aquimarina algiphila TaxID=2047982 RepID=A0A554VLG1_9FLAO|nr:MULTISPECIES: hypothetical protein [Aquimarina]TSE08930.1 hypothetical protein FOF46_10695 [Aquimarina algiphila]
MKKFEQLKQSNYRRLERKETTSIIGGTNCFEVRDACRQSCASPSRPEFFDCFIPCLANAGCYA